MTEKENKVLSDKNEPSPDDGQLELFTSPHVIEGSYDMTKYKGVSVSMEYFENIKRCRTFQTRKDDVFVISFPKSGTTWVQQIVNLIDVGGSPEKAQERQLDEKIPYLEFPHPGIKFIEEIHGPRFMKTHLPHHLLPEDIWRNNAKLIYIMRNPKDAMVSLYHFLGAMSPMSYSGPFSDFFGEYLADRHTYSPYWGHVRDYWNERHNKNLLFLVYEELQKDLTSQVKKIADFLGHSLTPDQIENVVHHSSFNQMKANKSANYSWWFESGLLKKDGTGFFRKGVIGDWKGLFTEEMNEQLEKKIKDELEPHGIKFTYE